MIFLKYIQLHEQNKEDVQVVKVFVAKSDQER